MKKYLLLLIFSITLGSSLLAFEPGDENTPLYKKIKSWPITQVQNEQWCRDQFDMMHSFGGYGKDGIFYGYPECLNH